MDEERKIIFISENTNKIKIIIKAIDYHQRKKMNDNFLIITTKNNTLIKKKFNSSNGLK